MNTDNQHLIRFFIIIYSGASVQMMCLAMVIKHIESTWLSLLSIMLVSIVVWWTTNKVMNRFFFKKYFPTEALTRGATHE